MVNSCDELGNSPERLGCIIGVVNYFRFKNKIAVEFIF